MFVASSEGHFQLMRLELRAAFLRLEFIERERVVEVIGA